MTIYNTTMRTFLNFEMILIKINKVKVTNVVNDKTCFNTRMCVCYNTNENTTCNNIKRIFVCYNTHEKTTYDIFLMLYY